MGKVQRAMRLCLAKSPRSARATVTDGLWEDDLIAQLEGAHENQRARQAHEWEAVRRRAERRAASNWTRL